MQVSPSGFDYIVIGSGSAGSTMIGERAAAFIAEGALATA